MNWKTLQEKFEAWAKSAGLDLSYHHKPGSPTVYFYAETNWSWQAWQASHAALVVELPPAPELPEDPEEAIDDSHMDAYHSAVRMRKACVQSITAAGLKVKP